MSAGAGAARALTDILRERKLAEIQAQQQAQQEIENQRADQRMAFDRDQFTADEAYRGGQVARQAQQDEVAAGERRQGENKRGQLQQMGDLIRLEGGMTPKARTFALETLTRIGEAPNAELFRDPEREFGEKKRVSDYEHQQGLERIREQGAQTRQTEGVKAKAGGNVSSDYTQERNVRTRQSIRELAAKVNNWTAGAGSMLARVPATDARNFAAELNTLKANIAFGELAAMRAASKTGGALGAVSERELALLESTLGALDAGQSPANLKAQLQKIDESIQRWEVAQGSREASDRAGIPPIRILSVEEVP